MTSTPNSAKGLTTRQTRTSNSRFRQRGGVAAEYAILEAALAAGIVHFVPLYVEYFVSLLGQVTRLFT